MFIENSRVNVLDDFPPDQKVKKTTKNKKRTTPSENTFEGATDILNVEDDFNEPTLGEKLASLKLLEVDKARNLKKDNTSFRTKAPSADSVIVLLRQALRADDHVLLLDCLQTQDEKVIANSVSLLSPSNVLKLLNSLISMVGSRGAVLVCALPWLKSLLLQHASGIMSQESFIHALMALYQLIESRVSTFQSVVQLSSILDYLFVGIHDDMFNEASVIPPTIYEDDESDEGELDFASYIDQESDEHQQLNSLSDLDSSDGMHE